MKASKPLTSKQLKERKNYERASVSSVIQPQTKKKAKNTEIDIPYYIKFNADKLADIIKQIESVREGLKILASEVRAH